MKRMNLKKAVYIMYGLVATYIALILLGAALKSILVIVLGLLCAIAGIVFGLTQLRCPYCDGHLRGGGKYCPHCGHHLAALE